jgi:hypothetical protein
MRSRIRPQSLAAIALTAVLTFAGSIAPVAGWSNGGDGGNGYGTHDWILDQALRLLDERGIGHGWVDRTIALRATDDPDSVEVAADPSRKIEHTYTATGRRGGAIHRITEHYAKLLRAHDANDDDEASYQLGMLAHFWGDLSMPYHTDQAAQEHDDEHHTYEPLVNALTNDPDESPDWSVANTNWDVSNMPNVRTAAVALAAFSRARYDTVHDNLDANDTSLNNTVKNVTEQLLIRASGDLADLIYSVPKGIGNPPEVGSLQLWARWHGVKGNEANQLIYGRVRDVNGDLMEGVRVDVTFPSGSGTKTWPFWTDETGEGHVRIEVGTPTLMVKKSVSGKVKTDQTSVTDGDWYYRTKKLDGESDGFWTDVSDRSVVQGQKVKIKTFVRTSAGKPISGLLVDWTWDLGGGLTMVTTGYTNDKGKATTSFVIENGTTHAQVYVYAHTSAYSVNRKSKTWFQRSD